MKKDQERKDHIISRKVITPWTHTKTDNRKDQPVTAETPSSDNR